MNIAKQKTLKHTVNKKSTTNCQEDTENNSIDSKKFVSLLTSFIFVILITSLYSLVVDCSSDHSTSKQERDTRDSKSVNRVHARIADSGSKVEYQIFVEVNWYCIKQDVFLNKIISEIVSDDSQNTKVELINKIIKCFKDALETHINLRSRKKPLDVVQDINKYLLKTLETKVSEICKHKTCVSPTLDQIRGMLIIFFPITEKIIDMLYITHSVYITKKLELEIENAAKTIEVDDKLTNFIEQTKSKLKKNVTRDPKINEAILSDFVSKSEECIVKEFENFKVLLINTNQILEKQVEKNLTEQLPAELLLIFSDLPENTLPYKTEDNVGNFNQLFRDKIDVKICFSKPTSSIQIENRQSTASFDFYVERHIVLSMETEHNLLYKNSIIKNFQSTQKNKYAQLSAFPKETIDLLYLNIKEQFTENPCVSKGCIEKEEQENITKTIKTNIQKKADEIGLSNNVVCLFLSVESLYKKIISNFEALEKQIDKNALEVFYMNYIMELKKQTIFKLLFLKITEDLTRIFEPTNFQQPSV
ncbi:hypothetical protein CDIK_0381, partial [Cucumispora dikerogammari]